MSGASGKAEYEWILVTDGAAFPPRDGAGALVYDNKMWLIGGWNTGDGIHWGRVDMSAPFSPCRGMIGGHAIFKDRVWLLGGGTYETPNRPRYTYANDVWSSADGKTWERHVEHAPWRGRVYHDVAVFDDRLWVMEGQGSEGRNVNDVWYSDNGQDWYEVPGTPWQERHASSVFVYRDALWMVAGNHMGRDIWKLERKHAK